MDNFVKNNYLLLHKNQIKVHLSDIILLHGETNYTHLHLQNGKKITISRTLKDFEMMLSNHHFYRIHRGFMINNEHLKSYNMDLGEVLLSNDYKIIASRRRKVHFEEKVIGVFTTSNFQAKI
jgi:two-component system, LytTR family, response regulator